MYTCVLYYIVHVYTCTCVYSTRVYMYTCVLYRHVYTYMYLSQFEGLGARVLIVCSGYEGPKEHVKLLPGVSRHSPSDAPEEREEEETL